jgi:hypothetical protein
MTSLNLKINQDRDLEDLTNSLENLYIFPNPYFLNITRILVTINNNLNVNVNNYELQVRLNNLLDNIKKAIITINNTTKLRLLYLYEEIIAEASILCSVTNNKLILDNLKPLIELLNEVNVNNLYLT